MAASTEKDKKALEQEEMLEQIKQQSSENMLQFDPETGEIKIVSADESAQDDPDGLIITTISDRGWASPMNNR